MESNTTNDPTWLEVAKAEIGVKERRGPLDNPRVIEYHKATSLKATSDSVPWCSSFINWVFEQVRIPSTRSARARSWMKWGQAIDIPRKGCVVVFWRGNPLGRKGHVGLYMGEDKRYIHVLGGNQSDSVSIAKYSKKRVLGYRWPA